MSNLDIARNALVFARDGLHKFKSANKIHTKVEKSLEKKRNLGEVDATIFRISKSQGFGRIENLRPSPGVRMAAVIAHGRAALKEKAVNCQEYAAVVCHYLDTVQVGGRRVDCGVAHGTGLAPFRGSAALAVLWQ